MVLGDYMNVQCYVCIGGINVGEDICKFDYGQYIVFGIFGCVVDMIRCCYLCICYIKMLVLDEVDELFNQGFWEQIYDVYCYLLFVIQVVVVFVIFFYDVFIMMIKFMIDFVCIFVKCDELMFEGFK